MVVVVWGDYGIVEKERTWGTLAKVLDDLIHLKSKRQHSKYSRCSP